MVCLHTLLISLIPTKNISISTAIVVGIETFYTILLKPKLFIFIQKWENIIREPVSATVVDYSDGSFLIILQKVRANHVFCPEPILHSFASWMHFIFHSHSQIFDTPNSAVLPQWKNVSSEKIILFVKLLLSAYRAKIH